MAFGILSSVRFAEPGDFAQLLRAFATEQVGEEPSETLKIVKFGQYPQTLVTDDALIARLNRQTLNWTVYPYYIGRGAGYLSERSDYMYYADVVYDGCSYRAVQFDHYRPAPTNSAAIAENSQQDENGYYADTVYWFRYDPIMWIVLDEASGLLFSPVMLDSQPFNNQNFRFGYVANNAGLVNNWELSTLRAWIGNDFYETAFSDESDAYVQTSLISNKSIGGRYDYPDTYDKVFLLSYEDISSQYTDLFSNIQVLTASGTDYAKCQGLEVNASGKSHWYLRSPVSETHYGVAGVYADGNISLSGIGIDYTQIGVRPAVRIDTEYLQRLLNCESGEHVFNEWQTVEQASIFKPGSLERTCSVCGYTEKKLIDQITVDINENTNYGLANFTVVNAQTIQPISGALITITTDTDGTGTFTTDAEGKVSVVLPVGIQTVSARAAGTLVRNLQVEILSGTNDIPKIGLSDMNTYDAKLTVKEMTYDEIVAAGIDPDAPENNHVFKYELQINFTAELDLYSLFYYMNSEDEVVGGESSDESSPHAVHWYAWGEGTPGGYFYIEEEDITVVPVTENFYIIIRGQVKWLKEMFDVEMLVINNSATDTLEDVVAELNLPEGLSLAAMVEGEQTLRQEIGTVEESSSKSVHWYVRGDVAGSYQLSAALTGKVMPFNEEINQTYTTENALQVWADNALHLDFEFPDAAYYADDYPITITLTNVSDKTLYKLSHTLGVIEGMEYYYDDGTTKKKITKKDIMGIGVLDEFNPGDKIVIETNVNIFFKSELLEAQKEQLIGMVSGFEQLMKCYKAITSAYSAAETLIGSVSGAYSALTSYSASPTSVFAGTAGKEKAEIAKKIYNAMAKLRKYTTTNNKIVDSVWNLFDATMSLNVVNDLKAIQQDPKTFFENNPINDLKSYYNKIKAVGEACESSVESASGVENYKFNLFDSIKTLISAIPIRFVVSSIVMTERAGSTTSIPYSVSTYSTGPHYFGVSDMSKYIMSITKMALSETINGVIPWYVKMFVNVDDILDTDEATKYIQATENEIKAFQAKESTGTTTWRAYVVRNKNAQDKAKLAKAKNGVSNGFEISCSNNNAVFEDGVLTFTGGAYIYVKPTSTVGGTLYIENSEGATYTYDISVVEAHSCVEGEKEIALAATQDRDGIAVTRCAVCNEIIDVAPITYSDCVDHNFSEWTALYEGDCQTCGIRQRSCATCGYTENEMTEYGDHIPEYRNAVAATCTEDGYEGDIYCSVCEEFIGEGNSVPATGHSFGEWTVITPADCQMPGVEQRVCEDDSGHIETREIPITDHVDKNGDGLCDNCGTEMAYTHGGTDEDNNRCKYCGQVHEGFLGKFIGFFHKIAYFFAHLFGKM